MNKNFAYLLMGLAGLALTSCSLFQKNTTIREESVIPQDREALQQAENVKTYKPEKFSKGVITGDWAIEEVMGKEAKGERAPYLKFVETDKERKMYGNNGCNTINATYDYNVKDSTLYFDNMLTTMMYCDMEGITDREINMALNNTKYYSLTETDDYNYMRFYDRNHSLLMVLMHQNFEFLNGAWRVVKIEDEPVNVEDMVLVFDVDERKIHGNTGCNVLNGTFDTDMDSPNSISVSNLAVTMMLCPDMEAQTALLIALEDANKAKPIKNDEVQFLNSDNNVVLLLKRKK